MKLSIKEIPCIEDEEVIVRCVNENEKWVDAIRLIASGEVTIKGYLEDKMYRIKLSDIYYFEVVEGRSFIYCDKSVFECKLKLYEFENLCKGSMLFRCSKSCILNINKIQYVRPSFSGRFEAMLNNNEKIIISRQYVGDLKRMLECL